MVERKQIVLEYHRAGKSVLFAGHNIPSAVRAFRSRYKKASPNTSLLVHTRTVLVEGSTLVVGDMVHEGTYPLRAIEAVTE